MKSKIVFFGTGPVAAGSLLALINSFDIELVITKAAPAHFKGDKPVEELAEQYNLPLSFANTGAEVSQIISSKQPKSIVGVIVDYGVIIPQDVLNAFKLGIVNSHFSLLPQWRGADPITFAILSGQRVTGVSLMIVEPALDTGKLIAQKELAIAATDTTPMLTDKLINLSNQMLLKYLPLYIDGKVKPINQPHPQKTTYSRKLLKTDQRLDPRTMTAAECERQVRAFISFPKSKLVIADRDCTITAASVDDVKTTTLDQQCQDGKYLVIEKLIPPNGKEMTALDFINGYLR